MKIQKNYRLNSIIIDLIEELSLHYSESDGVEFNNTAVIEFAVKELAENVLGKERVQQAILKNYERG